MTTKGATRAIASKFQQSYIFPFILRQVITGGLTGEQQALSEPEFDQSSPEFVAK